MSRATRPHDETGEKKLKKTAEAESVAGAGAGAEAENVAEEAAGAGSGETPATDNAAGEAGTDAGEAAATGDGSGKENEDIQNQFMRLAADFQNYRRRVEKEKSEIFAFANEKIMTELLPVLDNFERSLAVGSNDVSHLDGMKLIYKQLIEVLKKNGLTEVKAEGESFDPDFHHAVLMENKEGFSDGQVTEVLQKGYLLNNKIIRPAMVKVAE